MSKNEDGKEEKVREDATTNLKTPISASNDWAWLRSESSMAALRKVMRHLAPENLGARKGKEKGQKGGEKKSAWKASILTKQTSIDQRKRSQRGTLQGRKY